MARIAFYTQTYNVEKYIEKAIDSVLSQTYTDFVYYISDNNSSDRTCDVLKKYADTDERIILTLDKDKPNLKLYQDSLEVITNSDHEFLAILDHDDWYEPTFAQAMILALDEFDVDMAGCCTASFHDTTGQSLPRHIGASLVYSRDYVLKNYFSIWVHISAVWGKVFRISVIRENKIRLTDIYAGIDTLYVLEFSLCARSIFLSDIVLHNYRKVEGSYTSKYNKGKLISTREYIDYGMMLFEKQNALTDNIINSYYQFYTTSINRDVQLLFNSNLSFNDKIKEISEFISYQETVEQNILDKRFKDTLLSWILASKANLKKSKSSFVEIAKLQVLEKKVQKTLG